MVVFLFLMSSNLRLGFLSLQCKYGWPLFCTIIINILNKNNCVISLGGGAFINETVRKVSQKDNATIWLNWSLKTLIDRIKKNNKRPVASNLSNSELKDLLIYRSKIYSKANYKIECENMQKTEIVNKIIQLLKL